MEFNREKFKSLVHYVCWTMRENPDALGAVKLNKVLWRSDFRAYYETGHSITGARYVRRDFGPVPSSINSAVSELVRKGVLSVRDVPYAGETVKKEFTAYIAPDMQEFTEREIKIVTEAIEYVCLENTARSISEESHDNVWRVAKPGEELPYFTIFAIPGKITNDEREWARLELGY